MGIEPITFWISVRCSANWATLLFCGDGEFWNLGLTINSRLLCLWATPPVVCLVGFEPTVFWTTIRRFKPSKLQTPYILRKAEDPTPKRLIYLRYSVFKTDRHSNVSASLSNSNMSNNKKPTIKFLEVGYPIFYKNKLYLKSGQDTPHTFRTNSVTMVNRYVLPIFHFLFYKYITKI